MQPLILYDNKQRMCMGFFASLHLFSYHWQISCEDMEIVHHSQTRFSKHILLYVQYYLPI